jgi:hypothetical protein
VQDLRSRALGAGLLVWLLLGGPSSEARAAAAPPGRAAPVAERGARFADDDPANDSVVGPPDTIADCGARLDAMGIKYRAASVPLQQKRGAAYTCGTPQAVVYVRGPEGIKYNAAPLVSCGLALALGRFEHVVQEEAERRFGKRVRRIEQGGTYNCRRMTRFKELVSEHSYANAIDIRAFVLEDGRRIAVLSDFGPLSQEPAGERSRFLRALARRSFDEGVFSVVLTPYWDALHRDHFHLDLARYHADGTR